MKRYLPLLCCLLGACAQAHTHAIGRLFFTPQERHQLDIKRGLVAAPPAPPAPSEAAAPPPAPPPVTVNGFVRRSSGPSTVWVNGGDAQPGAVTGSAQAPRVTLTLPSGERVRIKPGQTLDPGAGTIRDLNER